MPLLNILFWNVQKKDLTAQIVNLAKSRDVDILVLAENPVDSVRLVKALNEEGGDYFPNHPYSFCEKITVITKFHYDFIAPVEEPGRLTTRQVRLPDTEEFLLTALHLSDKRNNSVESKNREAIKAAENLIETEIKFQNYRHLVLGDFNMNPFETGMVAADSFHGTMSARIAKRRGFRKIRGVTYPYFYNPTWSLFGDLNKEVSGTYHYQRAEYVCYEWNVFDQVLIRPGLIDNFVKHSLEIVQHDGVTSLITTRKTPDAVNHSDHLPLFFTLRI